MYITKPNTHNLHGSHKQTFALRCRLDSMPRNPPCDDETMHRCEDTSSSSAYSSSASSYWSASSWFCVHMSALWFIEHCQTCHTRSLLFLTPLPLFLSPSRSLLSPELGWWRENPPPPCSLFSFGRARARGEPLSLSLSHWLPSCGYCTRNQALWQLLNCSLCPSLSTSLPLSLSLALLLACLLACSLSLSLPGQRGQADTYPPARERAPAGHRFSRAP